MNLLQFFAETTGYVELIIIRTIKVVSSLVAQVTYIMSVPLELLLMVERFGSETWFWV